MENKHIYQDWLTLSQITDNAMTMACFIDVEKQYTQANRHYHTLAHVSNLLHQIKESRCSNKEKQLLTHVALFHDVIYVSTAKDNEYQSAQCAVIWLEKLGINKADQQKIHQLILATATHTSDDLLTQTFIDMDVSILGASQHVYKHYCNAIRKEYKNIPSLLYKRGRKRFLQATLKRTHIFLTKEYQIRYERQARMNILEELNSL